MLNWSQECQSEIKTNLNQQINWNQKVFYQDNKMPPKIRNLHRTKMVVKQFWNLKIVKQDRVKQNYTVHNIVKNASSFVKKNNIEFVKTIFLPLSW